MPARAGGLCDVSQTNDHFTDAAGGPEARAACSGDRARAASPAIYRRKSRTANPKRQLRDPIWEQNMKRLYHAPVRDRGR